MLLAALSTALLALPAPAASATLPSVATLLAGYERAVEDAGLPPFVRLESYGTLAGAGLSGEFHVWSDGERERAEQRLGPRRETTIRLGDRVWHVNADGNLREYTGIMLRRARTEHFIESGEFAKSPQRVVARGTATVDGHAAYALDVSAPAGETQTLYLDARTSLPLRVAYDDDDGRTTIDFGDWRSVGGRRFPFHSVASDGDHAFDTVETVTDVKLDGAIDPALFTLPASRTIEAAGVVTVPLVSRDGHLYVPVTIAGKTYSFLLDSGAQNVLLDRRVAQEAGIVPEGALEASGAQRVGGLQVARLDSLSIGAATMHDLVVTTLDLGRATAGAFTIDGILGYPFFAETIVRIDPVRPSMTFGAPGAFAPGGVKIPLEMDRAFPEARLQVNGRTTAPFIIDTGNAAELLLYRGFVERNPGVVPFTLTQRRSYGIGGSAGSYRTTLDRLDFGGFPLYHVETDVMNASRGAFADRFDAGNVGLGVLRNFALTFDVANGALYVERGPNYDDGRTR